MRRSTGRRTSTSSRLSDYVYNPLPCRDDSVPLPASVLRHQPKKAMKKKVVVAAEEEEAAWAPRFPWQKDTRKMTAEEKLHYIIYEMPTDVEGQVDRWIEISKIKL